MQESLTLEVMETHPASMESLINIESLFSLLIISLIFRLDFSLTIKLTRNFDNCPELGLNVAADTILF